MRNLAKKQFKEDFTSMNKLEKLEARLIRAAFDSEKDTETLNNLMMLALYRGFRDLYEEMLNDYFLENDCRIKKTTH